jgi:hypothetical protein
LTLYRVYRVFWIDLYHRYSDVNHEGLVVRHRRSGYARTIIPFDEDHEYWYVTEIQGKKVVEILRYSKREFDLMGEK